MNGLNVKLAKHQRIAMQFFIKCLFKEDNSLSAADYSALRSYFFKDAGRSAVGSVAKSVLLDTEKKHSPGKPADSGNKIRGNGNSNGENREITRMNIPKWKRYLDISLVVAGLPLWILLSLMVIVWIKSVSAGPVLFKQTRIGIGEKRFTILKFRSMKNGIESLSHEQHVQKLFENDIPLVKLDALGDPRVIPGGRFIRSTGLDELPQLLNVLRCEMSFVGPRPCLPQEYAFFTAEQRKRFEVLPGLTGLWQINKNYLMTFKEMNVMDVDYTKKASLWLDLVIMAKTPPALFRQIMNTLKGTKKTESENSSMAANNAS